MEIFYIVTLFSLLLPSASQRLNESRKLMSDMLADYDNRHRPILDQSKPIIVNVSFDLAAIQDFDEVEQKFSVIGILYLTWYDENIKWEPALYGGIPSQMYRSTDVWYPLLMLINPYETITSMVEDWRTLRIYSDGLVFFFPAAVFKASCDVDVTYYPFDTQTCKLSFVPWAYSSKEVLLNAATTEIYRTHYSENGEWTLSDTHSMQELTHSSNSVNFTFKLKRKPLFLLINFILPIIFMASIINLAFVLPPESGERASFTITVLLAIAVFLTLIGDNLPKKSEPMALACWLLLIILVISALTCVFAILNVGLYFKKSDLPVPSWCVTLTRMVQCGNVRQLTSTRAEVKPSKAKNELDLLDIQNAFERDKVVGHVTNSEKEYSTTNEESSHDNTLDEGCKTVTWQDVSSASDRICIVFFMAATLLCIVIFLVILVKNT